MGCESGFNFFQLNPKSPDFDLIIQAVEIFKIAVFAQADKIT